jgi:pyrimidine operon attenuation protein/uracil phosphoribosyltransferase
LEIILNKQQLQLTVLRLAHQLLEAGDSPSDIVFIGVQPRGVALSEKIATHIQVLLGEPNIQYGILDITFYRDDVRKEFHTASKTDIPFSIEGKKVVLIDDVLFTGRTMRAALDALQDFGRARKVELAVLVNRRFTRELPIQPDYTGISLDTSPAQKVKVHWDTEEVVLY